MKNKVLELSAIRIIATLFILFCHICQYYDFFLAWYLNVGVQMFLTLSGYLYEKKQKGGGIANTKKWYLQRFLRIYIPYIIVVLTIIVIMYMSSSAYFNFNQFIIQLFCLQGVFGCYKNLTHLWYITYILICYIITPWLQYFFYKYTPKYTILCSMFCRSNVYFDETFRIYVVI